MKGPILITGPPRSGTTLLWCMLDYAVVNRKVVPQETVPGDGQIGKVVTALLKSPEDAIVCIRDPRSIITSVLGVPPKEGKYFIGAHDSLKRWGLMAYFEGWKWCKNPFIVRYEDAVRYPKILALELKFHFGLEFDAPLEDFYKDEYGGELNQALNGCRPLDTGHDWRDPLHFTRLYQQFTKYPELFEIMEEWGYGQSTDDPAWREICTSAPEWRGNPAHA